MNIRCMNPGFGDIEIILEVCDQALGSFLKQTCKKVDTHAVYSSREQFGLSIRGPRPWTHYEFACT